MFIKTALIIILVQTEISLQQSNGSENHNNISNPRFLVFPDMGGNLHEVDLQAAPDNRLLLDILREINSVKYLLYTRSNPLFPQVLLMHRERTVLNSFFNASRPTVFFVDGWQSIAISGKIHYTYLDKLNVNFIAVDWSRLSLSDYVTSVNGVPVVGAQLGQFVNWLAWSFGLRYEDVHLIGFSLGAHVVGSAGRTVFEKVSRITALDPAGPLWYMNPNALKSTDAAYVEVIHTNSRLFGIDQLLGDVDFFPNGGRTQPGCITDVCDHLRGIDIYVATLKEDCYVARRCEDSRQLKSNTCYGGLQKMGGAELRKRWSPGFYRINTQSTVIFPFYSCMQ